MYFQSGTSLLFCDSHSQEMALQLRSSCHYIFCPKQLQFCIVLGASTSVNAKVSMEVQLAAALLQGMAFWCLSENEAIAQGNCKPKDQ